MSLQQHLRQRDERSGALAQLCVRHPGSEVVTLHPDDRFLHLLLGDAQGNRIQTWLNVDVWLKEMDAHLPDIPWGEVPLDYLARWMNHLQLAFEYADDVLDAITIGTSSTPLPEKALWLPAVPCPLLCLDWPDNGNNADEEQSSVMNQIPFRLQYVLGYTSLTLAQLIDVSVGDLLLIKQNFVHLAAEDRRLYRLNYHPNQEVIVEEMLTEHDLQQRYFRENEESLHDWSALPVELEFVLDGRTATLEELAGIMPGTALPLQSDAEQNIKIYLNKRLFARGELVALENGTLAVEVSHINPTLSGCAEDADAQ